MSNQRRSDIIIQSQETDMQFCNCVSCGRKMSVCYDRKSMRFFGLCENCKLYTPLMDGENSGQPNRKAIIIN